jgi:hypothetical protein
VREDARTIAVPALIAQAKSIQHEPLNEGQSRFRRSLRRMRFEQFVRAAAKLFKNSSPSVGFALPLFKSSNAAVEHCPDLHHFLEGSLPEHLAHAAALPRPLSFAGSLIRMREK